MNDATEGLSVVPLPDGSVGKQRIVERLEQLLVEARAGQYIGLVYILEEPGSFSWGKVNITYPAALGLMARCTYHINKEWDAA